MIFIQIYEIRDQLNKGKGIVEVVLSNRVNDEINE